MEVFKMRYAGAWRASIWAVLLMATAPAVAQDKPGKQASADNSAKTEVEGLYEVPKILTQAVNNISRRYNLNKAQHEFTQGMMEREVYRFLREHQDQVYPLIRDLSLAQGDMSKLTPEQRKRIGKAAQPLIEEARKAILAANAEWGKILSEDQKRLHQWDLDEMDGQFKQIRDNFQKMEQGEAVDNPIFPEPEGKTPPPPTPKLPPERKITLPETPIVVHDPDGVFDRAVEKFIKDYELDAAQAEAARSIGREYKEYAGVYRKAHQVEFDAAHKNAEEASRTGDIEKVRQAEAEEERLNAKILQWLDEMKNRLMSIPRDAQKAAYEQRQGASPAPTTAPAASEAKEGAAKPSTSQPAAAPARKQGGSRGTGGKAPGRKQDSSNKDNR